MFSIHPRPQHKDEEAAVCEMDEQVLTPSCLASSADHFLEKVPQSWSQEDVGFMS